MPHRKMAIVPALMVFAMLAAVTGCTGDGKSPSGGTSSAAAFNPNAVETAAPDGGALKVIESGFAYDSDKLGGGVVTFGAIIENTSTTSVAVRTQVYARFLDADGKTVQVMNRNELQGSLPAVPPGGRMGVADLQLGNRPGNKPPPVRIEVRIGPSVWWPVSKTKPFEVSNVKIGTDAAGETQVAFTVRCDYPGGAASAEVMVIERDATGKIVGGFEPQNTKLGLPWPAGQSQQRLIMGPGGGFSKVDVQRTEVYAGPGYATMAKAAGID